MSMLLLLCFGAFFTLSLALSLSVYLQLTQLKIDNNPFAKGFRDRDMAIPPPPISYNRPILPLWQMPPLPLPCK